MSKYTTPLTIAVLISIIPFLWLFTQTQVLGGFVYASANISGFLGATIILWQMLMGIRFVSKKLTDDYISVIKSHIFLGTYGTFFVLVHPIMQMYSYGQDWLFLWLPDFSNQFTTHVTYGRIALILFLFVWLSSALLRNRISYRKWQYIHYLSYPILGFVFIHSFQLGTYLQTFPLIRTYWYFLTAVYAGLVIWRLAKFFNYGKYAYRLNGKQNLSDGITIYSFKPKNKKLIPKPGQFVFIKPGVISESHPFTVMNFDKTTGELKFGIKAVGKFTNQLEKIKQDQNVYIDGPYGVFTQEGQNDQPKVVIAGGIGVTPFVELINRFGDQSTYMFYSNKQLSDAVNRKQFQKELGQNYHDVVTREKVKKQPVIEGRLDAEKIKNLVPEEILEQANYFICGSVRFMAGIQKTLQKLDVPKSRIFMEEFSL